MAHIPIRVPWKDKPTSGSKINRDNPLTRGLLRFWTGGAYSDLDGNILINDHSTEGKADINNYLVPPKSHNGQNLNFGASSYKTLTEQNATPVSGSAPRTFVGMIYNTSASTSYIFGINAGTGGATGERWDININGGNLRIEIHGAGATTLLDVSSGFHVIAVKLTGSTLADNRLFVDGVFEDASGANAVNTNASNKIRFGSRSSTGTTVLAVERVCWGAFWNRALSDFEILQIYKNPWQLLQPQTRYLDVSVAGSSFQPAWAINSTLTQGIAGVASA